jgi:hypothetical protein
MTRNQKLLEAQAKAWPMFDACKKFCVVCPSGGTTNVQKVSAAAEAGVIDQCVKGIGVPQKDGGSIVVACPYVEPYPAFMSTAKQWLDAQEATVLATAEG